MHVDHFTVKLIPKVINEEDMAESAQATLAKVIKNVSDIRWALDHRDNNTPTKQAMISHSLFTNVVLYNVRIKKQSTKEELVHGLEFKKTLEGLDDQPFHIFELVVNQNFDKYFDSAYRIDWNRFFRFCNRIDLDAVSYEDPYARAAIRRFNSSYSALRHDLPLASLFGDTFAKDSLKPEILLTVLELGLITYSQIKDLDVIAKVKFDPSKPETYLRILVHLITLANDEAFLGLPDSNYYFKDEYIMNMLRVVLEKLGDFVAEKDRAELMRQNIVVEEAAGSSQIKLSKDVTKYVNMLLISLFNPPNDFYSKSVSTLESNHGQSSEILRNPAQRFPPSRASKQIEELEDLMTQILQKYYAVNISEITPDLCRRIHAIFKAILQSHASDPEFKRDFALTGGCYAVLSLLHLVTPSADLKTDESATAIIGEGLFVLESLCDSTGAVGSQIFKARCFNILKRLAWFNLREVSLLILAACKTSPWILENSAENIERVNQLFFDSFNNFILNKDDSISVSETLFIKHHRSVTVLCFVLREIIRNIRDLQVKQTMQLRFQDAAALQTMNALKFINETAVSLKRRNSNEMARGTSGKRESELLIGHEWENYFIDKARAKLEYLTKDEAQFELHYFVIGLFNECVVGIEALGVKSMLVDGLSENGSEATLEILKPLVDNQSHTKVFFFSYLLNIYCNCLLLETDIQQSPESREKGATNMKLETQGKTTLADKKLAIKAANDALMFHKGKEDTITLLRFLPFLQVKEGDPEEVKRANRDLMFRSVLRFMMKYFKGLLYEKEKIQQQNEMDQEPILKLFIMKKETILIMCDIERSNPLWDDSTLVLDTNGDPKLYETIFLEDEMREHFQELQVITGSYAKRNLTIILQFIHILYKLYAVHKQYLPEIEAFEREGVYSLQKGYSKRFDDISTLGSVSMSKFIRNMGEGDTDNNVELDLFNKKVDTLLQRKKEKNLKATISSTEDAINEYRRSKSLSLHRKLEDLGSHRSLLLKTLGEGTDNSKDMFYKNIIMWLMKTFSEQLVPYETKLAKKPKKPKQLPKSLVSKERVAKEDESLLGFSQTFTSEPLVPQLVTVIGNLFNIDLRPRDVYLETYFTKEKSGILENEADPTSLSNSQRLYDDRRGLITLLIEAALSMQQKIRKRLFTKNIKTISEHYFLACLTIKDLIKGNMIQIKKFIGRECFNKENSGVGTRNIIQELFQGLVYDKNPQNANNIHINNNDRADLAYYNIITLTTLTELVSGPCKANQDSIGDSFTNVLTLLEKTNCNINSHLYKVQEAMVLFLAGLLEEGNLKNCKRFSSDVSPSKVYNIICKHVSHLSQSDQIEGHDSLVGKAIKKIMSSKETDMEALTSALREYYKKYNRFSGHPSIVIAIRLYFLMREVISSNCSKKYDRFIKEREQAAEFEEFNADKLVENYGRLKASEVPSKRGHSSLTKRIIASTFLQSKTNQIMPGGIELAKTDSKMATSEGDQAAKTLHNGSIFHFVQSITASVEILYQTGDASNNIQIYFPRLPSTFNFSEEQKYEFLQTSSIQDSNSKVLDLMNFVADIQIEMNRSQAQTSNFLKKVSHDSALKWYMIALCLLGVFVNVIYFFFFRYIDGTGFTIEAFDLVIYIVRLVMIAFSGLVFCLWMVVKYPIKLEKHADRVENEEVVPGERSSSFTTLHGYYEKYFKTILYESLPLTSLVHIVSCLLSIYISPVFIPLHLYTIMAFSRTTRYVITSMTQHIDQLMMTLLLAIICIYFYSILIADYFGTSLIDSNSSDDLNRCQSLGSCFFYSLQIGLTNGDGVGVMISQVGQNSTLFIPRLLLNLSFFILLNLAAMNIIFGIILDTFAELRDDQQARGTFCSPRIRLKERVLYLWI